MRNNCFTSRATLLIFIFCLLQILFKQNGSTDMPVKDSKDSNMPSYVIHTMSLYFSAYINSNITTLQTGIVMGWISNAVTGIFQ